MSILIALTVSSVVLHSRAGNSRFHAIHVSHWNRYTSIVSFPMIVFSQTIFSCKNRLLSQKIRCRHESLWTTQRLLDSWLLETESMRNSINPWVLSWNAFCAYELYRPFSLSFCGFRRGSRIFIEERAFFHEIPKNSDLAKYIEAAKFLNILSGQVKNNRHIFRPNDSITRSEISKVVVNAFGL